MFKLFRCHQAQTSPSQTLNRWQGEATVKVAIQPNQSGRVHFRASYWNAKCPQAITLNPGDIVEVTGIDNITLIVEPSSLN
ncbi:MAG: hypothetical protein F6K50_32125 [Moorea sp. SIO3I7]|uniref:NfeD-like C-terminal domain-containing protein n=1 Tax=Moorena bouillonii PNG TaxID=568701 RepID=A0A1U7NAJ2_9CYAN|nr:MULTISPECIES: NfeD family protein [Moorena]NEN99952.1 hypothetical protein [Moorena sp. SIO3I7]NEO49611.1 hypothetical protein [Moorena sp. SIO4A3]NEO61747.1 hypothetical protein [Moorena sp. SIO4G2]NEQ83860.1 hypothetical protein [Moorena sp. SIO2I5]NEO10731.1 hypothetical protein [Moorena sp. SIO3I8]